MHSTGSPIKEYLPKVGEDPVKQFKWGVVNFIPHEMKPCVICAIQVLKNVFPEIAALLLMTPF